MSDPKRGPIRSTLVGVRECGCVVAAIVVNTDSAARGYQDELLGRSVRDWALRGLAISLVTAGEVRSRLKRCTCEEDHAETVKRIAELRASVARDKLAADLRAQGLTYIEIGARIGVSKSYARCCAQRGVKRRSVRVDNESS